MYSLNPSKDVLKTFLLRDGNKRSDKSEGKKI